MSSANVAKDLEAVFRFLPVAGYPNRSVISSKLNRPRRVPPKRGKDRSTKMTDEDWDKFEKDIADAFEQVP